MVEALDIGEVAARSGMAASTLRYYEREGIIGSSDRKGLRRQYAPGFSRPSPLWPFASRPDLRSPRSGPCSRPVAVGPGRTLAERKRDELRVRITHLTTIADQLDHALGCPSPNVFDCEHFRAALDHALPVIRHRGAHHPQGG